MDKIVAIKIKQNDGTYSSEIPISAQAGNIQWDGTHSLIDILGTVNTNKSIQSQINEKINISELQTHIYTVLGTSVNSWLQEHLPSLSEDRTVIIDDTLTMENAAANAKATGDIKKGSRLYPFDTPLENILIVNNSPVYSASNAGIRNLNIVSKNNQDYYVRTFFSLHQSEKYSNLIISTSNQTHFFNITIYNRGDQAPDEIETHSAIASDGSTITVTIDWSKVNKDTWYGVPYGTEGFKISEECIKRDIDLNMIRLYPFDWPLDKKLQVTRNNRTWNIYNSILAGIKYLKIQTKNTTPFYLKNLYRDDANHYRKIEIRSIDDKTVFAYYNNSNQGENNRPTFIEEINLNGIDSSDGNKPDGSTMTVQIDWSKVNNDVGWGLDIQSYIISETCIHRIDYPDCSFIPITDYYVIGGDLVPNSSKTVTQQRIYMNEIAQYKKDGYFKLSVINTAKTIQINEPDVTFGENGVSQYIEFNIKPQSQSREIVIRCRYYIRNSLKAIHDITVHIMVGTTLPAKKYMFIGDSLTDAGVFEQQFANLNPGLVTLCGTRQQGDNEHPIYHEGRSGWSSTDYLTKASKGTGANIVYNPFYNPLLTGNSKFDFSYYMEYANVPVPDCVIIFLGRNDSNFTETTINNIKTMVASILTYNSNIKCYVMGAYNIACNDTGIGKARASSHFINNKAHIYNRDLFYPVFNNPVTISGEQVTIKPIPAHLNLDNKYDYAVGTQVISNVDSRTMEVYTDTVHPSKIGYKKFGYAINAFFHHEFNQNNQNT